MIEVVPRLIQITDTVAWLPAMWLFPPAALHRRMEGWRRQSPSAGSHPISTASSRPRAGQQTPVRPGPKTRVFCHRFAWSGGIVENQGPCIQQHRVSQGARPNKALQGGSRNEKPKKLGGGYQKIGTMTIAKPRRQLCREFQERAGGWVLRMLGRRVLAVTGEMECPGSRCVPDCGAAAEDGCKMGPPSRAGLNSQQVAAGMDCQQS